jgi:hypothetical protein
MRKKIEAWLDMNDDGELTIEDLSKIVVRHEWMLIAGIFIFIGAIGNVMEWWGIDSDAFWAAAGLAAILEYMEDMRGRLR